MYVRYCAWLNTVPEPDDGKVAAKGLPKSLSRLEQFELDGIEPLMPPLWPAAHIVEYFWMIGPTQESGMGEGVISHQEIAAWQCSMGVDLNPWEVSLLRRLSRAYLVECHAAKDPYCKPPFGDLYKNPNLSQRIDAALD